MAQQTARREMAARAASPALIEGLITTKAKMIEALEKYLEKERMVRIASFEGELA